MRAGISFLLFVPLLVSYASAHHYVLTDEYIGRDFLQSWNWWTGDDPTNGKVNYVSRDEALAKNLTYASDTKFVMRADFQNIVPPDARGRDSIRINSTRLFDEAVVVIDLQHMPEGCGTWPAFWTLSQNGPWPQGGEVDIIEGVNLAQRNQAALHTSPDCTMQIPRVMTGTALTTNCDASVNYNEGCGVGFTKPATYGAAFNSAGGGYFAMARSKTSGIRIWFWSRSDPDVPGDIKYGAKAVHSTLFWGVPEATYSLQENCEYEPHFDQHALVFDLTLCGDWAGSNYPTSGCPGTCNDLVLNNPAAFIDAYWEVNSIRVYTPQ